MAEAKVCSSCGGVALPPESETAEHCTTSGCEKKGQPLEIKEVGEGDSASCSTCGGSFLNDAGHSHDS